MSPSEALPPAPSFERLHARRAATRAAAQHRATKLRQALLAQGPAVFRRFGICEAFLYGSVGRGACRRDSDLDLLVLPLPNETYWDCLHALEEALGVPIDLHTDQDDPHFVQKIIERGKKVYGP